MGPRATCRRYRGALLKDRRACRQTCGTLRAHCCPRVGGPSATRTEVGLGLPGQRTRSTDGSSSLGQEWEHDSLLREGERRAQSCWGSMAISRPLAIPGMPATRSVHAPAKYVKDQDHVRQTTAGLLTPHRERTPERRSPIHFPWRRPRRSRDIGSPTVRSPFQWRSRGAAVAAPSQADCYAGVERSASHAEQPEIDQSS